MVMFPESDSAKPVDARWQQFRQRARETAFSINEFSNADQIRYDLDTARITGRENPDTYKVDRPIDMLGENGLDIRNLPRFR